MSITHKVSLYRFLSISDTINEFLSILLIVIDYRFSIEHVRLKATVDDNRTVQLAITVNTSYSLINFAQESRTCSVAFTPMVTLYNRCTQASLLGGSAKFGWQVKVNIIKKNRLRLNRPIQHNTDTNRKIMLRNFIWIVAF